MASGNLVKRLMSPAGLAVLFVALVVLNVVLSAVPARLDLTAGRVYTLSDGTRQVLAKLDAPVVLRFYYTQSGDTSVPVALNTFAKRVQDLLAEYVAASNGRLVLERLNPEPDSDAEDAATRDGIDAQVTPNQEKFYLGLAIERRDAASAAAAAAKGSGAAKGDSTKATHAVAIPVLSPERERLLEYDITRAIAQAMQAQRPVIGVMSAIPVFGRPMELMLGRLPTGPWIAIQELQRNFDVRPVPMESARIPDEVKVLLVIHPRDIAEAGEYAIDQFLMRGGRLIAFVDPYAYFDQQRNLENPLAGNTASESTFQKLLGAWGYTMPTGKIVADLTLASNQNGRTMPTLLNVQGDALNKDDLVIGQVGALTLPFPGWFAPVEGKAVAGLTATPLLRTSSNSMLIDPIIATLTGADAARGFQPSGKAHALALRLSGRFPTAFPDGPPKSEAITLVPLRDGAPADPAPPLPTPADPAAHLGKATADAQVVLVADIDMLADGVVVQIQESFGQQVRVPINGNLDFLQSLVEAFAGDTALGALRSRAAFSRPLTVPLEIAERAQQEYLGAIKELEDDLIQTQDRLQKLQRARGPGSVFTPSAEQQAEIDAFQRKSTETKAQLKELRRTLRLETDRLELVTKVVNIALMPTIVAFAGLGLFAIRRRRLGR
ncbi:MAG: GldG family protein [Proteobacteria bacterium]|nr:GldG family protein [Pseudomonadota bacterium]